MQRRPSLPTLFAASALAAALGGCQRYVASPVAGFGAFIGETHSLARADASAAGGDETIRRAQGYAIGVDPLLPEPGNVWPGPAAPDKSLNDIQREQNAEQSRIDQSSPEASPRASPQISPQISPQAKPGEPRSPLRGSSTSPGSVQTMPSYVAPAPAPASISPAPIQPNPAPLIGAAGQAIIPDANNNGVRSAIVPGQPGQSIVVPNGNGTTTVIGPDGSTQVVPSAR